MNDLLRKGRKLPAVNEHRDTTDTARQARFLRKHYRSQSEWTTNCPVFIKQNDSPEETQRTRNAGHRGNYTKGQVQCWTTAKAMTLSPVLRKRDWHEMIFHNNDCLLSIISSTKLIIASRFSLRIILVLLFYAVAKSLPGRFLLNIQSLIRWTKSVHRTIFIFLRKIGTQLDAPLDDCELAIERWINKVLSYLFQQHFITKVDNLRTCPQSQSHKTQRVFFNGSFSDGKEYVLCCQFYFQFYQ